MQYHVSEDGTPRKCSAQTPASCTVRGADGESASSGEFSSPEEALRFAEDVNGNRYGGAIGEPSQKPSAGVAEQADKLLADYRADEIDADEAIQELVGSVEDELSESGSKGFDAMAYPSFEEIREHADGSRTFLINTAVRSDGASDDAIEESLDTLSDDLADAFRKHGKDYTFYFTVTDIVD